jgi:hypothetical protein
MAHVRSSKMRFRAFISYVALLVGTGSAVACESADNTVFPSLDTGGTGSLFSKK